MALFRTVSTTLTGKAMVAAATLTIVSGTAAGAAGLLAEDPPTALEEVTDTSEDGTQTEDETTSPDPLEEEATEESQEEAPAEDETPEEALAAEDEDEALTDGDTSDAEGRSANATRVLGELGDGCMPQDDDCHFGQEVSARAREKGPEKSAAARGKKADRTAPEAPEGTAADDEDDAIEPEPVTEEEPAAAEEVAAPDDEALTVASTESSSPRGKSKRR